MALLNQTRRGASEFQGGFFGCFFFFEDIIITGVGRSARGIFSPHPTDKDKHAREMPRY